MGGRADGSSHLGLGILQGIERIEFRLEVLPDTSPKLCRDADSGWSEGRRGAKQWRRVIALCLWPRPHSYAISGPGSS
jgi:hypothetical protein